MAEDLRKYLDVDEGIRCMIFGKRTHIPEDKVKFYLAYSKSLKAKQLDEEKEENENEDDESKQP